MTRIVFANCSSRYNTEGVSQLEPGLGFDNPGYRVTLAYFRNPEGVCDGSRLTENATLSGLRHNSQLGDIPGLAKPNPGLEVTITFGVDSLCRLTTRF